MNRIVVIESLQETAGNIYKMKMSMLTLARKKSRLRMQYLVTHVLFHFFQQTALILHVQYHVTFLLSSLYTVFKKVITTKPKT